MEAWESDYTFRGLAFCISRFGCGRGKFCDLRSKTTVNDKSEKLFTFQTSYKVCVTRHTALQCTVADMWDMQALRERCRPDIDLKVVLLALRLAFGSHMLADCCPIAEAKGVDAFQQQCLLICLHS